MAKRLEIMVASGELSGKRFEVPAAGLRLGRSSSNDIHVPDEELSRSHCLFECSGEIGISLTDLASANGTFVNGDNIGAKTYVLKAGDEILVGQTVIKVLGDGGADSVPPAVTGGKNVDLGFGPTVAEKAAAEAAAVSDKKGMTPSKIAMLGVIAVLVGLIVYVLLYGNPLSFISSSPRKPASSASSVKSDEIISFYYEKVEADSARVFRYASELNGEGFLSVQFDDLPSENRHVPPAPKKITESDMKILKAIFDDDAWSGFKNEYKGSVTGFENTLKFWRIKLVRKDGVKEVVVQNELEPEGFAKLRGDLETWSNNVLGVQSIERSREELVRSSEENEALGDEKWDKRDVLDRNLSDAIGCYTLAKNDLASLGASAGDIDRIQRKIDKAKEELNARYKEVRYEADRLRTIGDLERAREEFAKIRAMIPVREDSRHREAEKNIELIELKMYESKGKGNRR